MQLQGRIPSVFWTPSIMGSKACVRDSQHPITQLPNYRITLNRNYVSKSMITVIICFILDRITTIGLYMIVCPHGGLRRRLQSRIGAISFAI